jgi:hypothetical protein
MENKVRKRGFFKRLQGSFPLPLHRTVCRGWLAVTSAWQQHTVVFFFLFFLRACGNKHTTPNSTSFPCWPDQRCCAVAAVRPAKGFSPWTHFLRAIPCDAPTHLSCCNRYVKDATYACDDPISSAARAACRNLRSHHTFHHKNGRKQAVSPSSSNELRHMH